MAETAWMRLGALVLALAGLSGCQSLDMNSVQLRVIDASMDAGALDLYQNNVALAYNVGFSTMTSYVSMAPGTYTLSADKAGTRQALASEVATLGAGRQYTEIIGSSAAALQQTVLLDQTTPAPSGQIALRFVHQALRSGAVDVYLVPKGGRLAGSSPLEVNLGVGANSGYLLVPAGTYAIDIVPTGASPALWSSMLMNGAQVEYASGAVRTVVLIDQEILGAHTAGLSAGVQAIVGADADQ
jgi:hypothetical protein